MNKSNTSLFIYLVLPITNNFSFWNSNVCPWKKRERNDKKC